jgi:hypothetical protein
MESHGVPGAIHCTEAAALLLQGVFQLQARGAMGIKGKGEMHTFLLLKPEGVPNGDRKVGLQISASGREPSLARPGGFTPRRSGE